MRRVIALGVGVLIVILLLLAVRGCLNARKERGFENYASDLGAIATQANQLSAEFFGRLQDPPKNLSEVNLEAEIASDRGSAEGLLDRVEGLDVPDQVSGAQDELVQAFELRRDALAGIAEDIPAALGNEDRSGALARIAGDMRAFLASDVLYERARLEIQGVLEDEGIDDEVPASVFLPEPATRWLDELELSTVLSTFATNTGAVKGVHGLALLSASIDDTPLTADAENTVSLGKDPPELTVEIQNQGDSVEKDVVVSYSISGGAVPIEGQQTIPSLDAQGIREQAIGFESEPETDTPLTLRVEVLPVPGETVTDNNTFTYTVTFN
ncbi:MAG: hypothetical protein GEU88_01495 [Solirubrobacterales bacterium]|nr:hypothetical protein [Solirubrobacterales bacterium]